jgi:hypothetical protein
MHPGALTAGLTVTPTNAQQAAFAGIACVRLLHGIYLSRNSPGTRNTGVGIAQPARFTAERKQTARVRRGFPGLAAAAQHRN